MAKTKFSKVQISAITCSVPDIEKHIDDDIDLFGGTVKQIERIKRTIGLNTRFVVDKNTTSADLCEHSAMNLIKSNGICREDLGALICVTQTPDHFQPSNATRLHGRLGLSEDCACFDVNLGCSGYVYGLWIAHLIIESGSCDNILLLAGDTMSKCVNPKDRSVAILFGDAGSATLLQRVNKEEVLPAFFSLKTNGKGYQHLIMPAGGFRIPKSPKTKMENMDNDGNVRSLENLYMNGAEIFNFSIKVEPQSINEILELSGEVLSDIDYIFFHQANKYIIGNIIRRLNFPVEKTPCGTVEKFGNQSSASIPVTICDTMPSPNEIATRVILSGFGVGLSWATCLTTLKNVQTNLIKYRSV